MSAATAVNFGGVGGDRDISITDGTNVWTVIPAAVLQAIANGVWNSVQVPGPVSIPFWETTQPNTPLLAIYSGGTTDYTVGSVDFTIFALLR